jgi:hypothetical protein
MCPAESDVPACGARWEPYLARMLKNGPRISTSLESGLVEMMIPKLLPVQFVSNVNLFQIQYIKRHGMIFWMYQGDRASKNSLQSHLILGIFDVKSGDFISNPTISGGNANRTFLSCLSNFCGILLSKCCPRVFRTGWSDKAQVAQ